jgi:hypothetical protein
MFDPDTHQTSFKRETGSIPPIIVEMGKGKSYFKGRTRTAPSDLLSLASTSRKKVGLLQVIKC